MNKMTREYLDSVVAERDKLKAINADMLAALELVLIRAEQEYRELTDGNYGKFADFPEAQQARAAIAKARGKA